jgi:uncharacterized FlaG/YvyC family protein
MGPIPSLPSSGIPLAPALPLAETETAPRRGGDPRPVLLPLDRVLPTGRGAAGERARDPAAAPRTPAESADSRAEEERERPPPRAIARADLASAGIHPLHHAVTYRVHPDLEHMLQSARIDRDTDETLREVPSEERIQLSRSFREHLGAVLDAYA